MRDLHALLEQSYDVDLTDWTFLDAIGVSDDGRTIAGYGDRPQTLSWIAVLGPCGNGVDDDGDGRVDHPDDPGCASAASSRESRMCQDGIDNQGDGTVDFDGGASALGGVPIAAPDPKCLHPYLDGEVPSCGLGVEIALAVAPLMRRWGRHAARRAGAERV
jgi:hypothetical protein